LPPLEQNRVRSLDPDIAGVEREGIAAFLGDAEVTLDSEAE
jgi:hypothetical protein